MKFKELKRELLTSLNEERFTSSEILELEGILQDARTPIEVVESFKSIFQWLDTKPCVVGELVAKVYRDYQVWCLKQNVAPVTNMMFSREIGKKLKVKSKVMTIKGKSHRVYVKNY